VWDGAHNPAGASFLLRRLRGEHVLVVSILADKDARRMLRTLAHAGDTVVATSSSNPRALSAAALAELAGAYFARVEAVDDPAAARERALRLAGPGETVLVTGSLYLLADLEKARCRDLVPR
jgi:folylpolyglutamate synthase/dihydropteroate synthase